MPELEADPQVQGSTWVRCGTLCGTLIFLMVGDKVGNGKNNRWLK